MDHLTPHPSLLSLEEHEKLNHHKALVLWFTGLSGSGKSTIATKVEKILAFEYGVHTALLDGDSMRRGLNSDLGFTDADRTENIRRAGEVAALMAGAGLIVLTAFISPFAADRELARSRLPAGKFWEIFVDCPLEVCLKRDPKKLYQRAQAGEIPQFTGVSSPYEAPTAPELHLHSDRETVEACARRVVTRLLTTGMIE